MNNSANDNRPLDSCCKLSRRARIPILLGAGAKPSGLTPMLYNLISKYAQTRLDEINQTLFRVMFADTPFWGIYDKSVCASQTCNRELHVLLVDAQMLSVIDQLVRRLYALISCDPTGDLRFRGSTCEEQHRAKHSLTNLIFRSGSEPLASELPPFNQLPHAWLTEALCIAFVFMVIHETSHQGPQTIGADYLAPLVPAALAGAELAGVKLRNDDAVRWAKELAADMNALLLIATNYALIEAIPDEQRVAWYRSMAAGVAIAIKAWEIIIHEQCYGDPVYIRLLLRTHPPAKWRIDQVISSVQTAERLSLIVGDATWAHRVLAAIDDLYCLRASERTT